MAKLNQIIAIAAGRKSTSNATITEIYKTLQKDNLFKGVSRSYQPIDEEGERLPDENQMVQTTVAANLEKAAKSLESLLDIVATQEYNNCEAKADVIVDGQPLLTDVPVTYLLFLDKQLENVKTLVSKLPTLSADARWTKSDSDDNLYVTDVVKTVRTKKVPRAFTKAEATKEHPARS